jgi:hypothetical protein
MGEITTPTGAKTDAVRSYNPNKRPFTPAKLHKAKSALKRNAKRANNRA